MSAAASQERTVFQKMITGDVPARFILRSDLLQVAAIFDNAPADPNPKPGHTAQVVVFPYENTFTYASRAATSAAIQAIEERMYEAYQPAKVVKHEEGYDVNHPHVVMWAVYERGESALLHRPDRLAPENRLTYERMGAYAAPLIFDAAAVAGFEKDAVAAFKELAARATGL